VIDPRTLPERPPSEVEWEELLVKLEIAARAVRLAAGDAADSPDLRRALAAALVVEDAFGRHLEDLRQGREITDLHGPWGPDAGPLPDPGSLAAGIADRRARNFAAVQRRGIDVWEWRSPLTGGGAVSAYQLVQSRVQADAALLAELRRIG
jgi:hypothetical protein